MLFSSVLLEVVGILASCNLGLSLPMLFAMLRFFVDKWCCFIDSNSSRSFCSCYIYIYIYIYIGYHMAHSIQTFLVEGFLREHSI